MDYDYLYEMMRIVRLADSDPMQLIAAEYGPLGGYHGNPYGIYGSLYAMMPHLDDPLRQFSSEPAWSKLVTSLA